MLTKLLSILSLSTTLSLAIDPNFIKGSTVIMKPDAQDLTPVYAASMLETGWLENLRMLWQVGLKENIEPYAQLKGTETDNPHSQTALLLQYLFPSPDGAALALNNRDFFALRPLTFAQLGDVYALADKRQSPEKLLRTLLEKNRRAEGAKLATVMLAAFEEDKNQFVPNLARHAFIAYVLKTATSKLDLWGFLKTANLIVDTSDTTRDIFLADRFPDSTYDKFKDSMDKDYVDPRELKKRHDFLEVFIQHQQGQIDAGVWLYTPTGQRITTLPTASSHLVELENSITYRPTAITTSQLMSNPEYLYYTGYTYARSEKMNFIVPYGNANFMENNKRYSFSDCAEATLFSLINGLTFDPKTRRPSLARLPRSAHPELKTLYKEIAESTKLLNSFRPRFSALASNLKAVEYVKKSPLGSGYEIVSTVDNFLTALAVLMGTPEFEDPNSLFSLFNTETDLYGIDLESAQPNKLHVQRNGISWFEIQSSGNHTQLKAFTPSIEWGNKLSRTLLSSFYENGASNQTFILSALFESKYLWRWYSNSEEIPDNYPQTLTMALTAPLMGTKYRMQLLETTVVTQPHNQKILSDLTGISSKISYDDPHTARGLFKLFRTLGFAKIQQLDCLSYASGQFLSLCNANSFYAWLGHLAWQDPNLVPLCEKPLMIGDITTFVDENIPGFVLTELLTPQHNPLFHKAPDPLAEHREPHPDTPKFLNLYKNFIDSNDEFRELLAHDIFDSIISLLLETEDTKALTLIIDFIIDTKTQIKLNYDFICLMELLSSDEELALKALQIYDFLNIDLDFSISNIFTNSKISKSVRLIIFDKLINENSDLLNTLQHDGKPLTSHLLQYYCNEEIAYNIFLKLRDFNPDSLIQAELINLYEYSSLPNQQKEELKQFIMDRKGQFQALYPNPAGIPYNARALLS